MGEGDAEVSTVSPVFVELRAATGQFQAKMAEAEASLKKLSRQGAGSMAKLQAVGKGAFLGLAGASAVVGVASVKMAADFQQATNQLITSAGESRAQIDLVRKGLLEMSTQVGSSATELAKGMYLVESAGFHGAAGLQVLKAATQGAKAEGANFETVANAVTSAMNSYKVPASQAVNVTDALVATVAAGKMRMEDLAGAIGGVLPVAAAAHLSLSEVGGAMATMSAQGTPASVAATYLRQTIGQLENPSKKARNEMTALGLSALDISQNLGARGLTGTLDLLVKAIESKMGPQGVVMLNSLRKAGDNSEKFQAALNELPPAAQTYVGALSTMVGGVKTMQAALQLSGPHLEDFRRNTEKVAAGAKNAGKDVAGWDIVQQNFNQKMALLQANLSKLAIELGMKLIPAIEATVGWMTRHKNIVVTLAAIIGGVLVASMTIWIAKLTIAAAQTALLAAKVLTLNAREGVAVLLHGQVAAAMDAEALSAGRLALALGEVAAALAVVVAAKKWADAMNQSINQQSSNEEKAIRNDAMTAPLLYLEKRGLNRQGKWKHGDWSARIKAAEKGDNPQAVWDIIREYLHGSVKKAVAAGPKKKAGAAGDARGIVDVSGIERELAAETAAYDAAHKKAKKHRTTAEALAEARRRARATQEAAVAAVKAAQEKIQAHLRLELAARNEIIRAQEIQARLTAAAQDVSLVNGRVINAGTSFRQLAQAGGHMVTVNVMGSVVSERDLVDVVHNGLLQSGRRNVNVGLG